MDALTEWKGFARLLQSFAGERVGREELRWAPDEYRDPLDSPEFLQLGAVAATLKYRQGNPRDSVTPAYKIEFKKRSKVKKGDWPTRDAPPMTLWEVAPEKRGHWLVRESGNVGLSSRDLGRLSSRDLADKTKNELIRYYGEFIRALEDLKAHL